MVQDEDYTPEYIKNLIIAGYIQALLTDPKEYKKEIKKFNPYSLDSKVKLRFENKFINGVKGLPSASKPLPPAYKKTFTSEVEIGSEINGIVEPSAVYGTDKDCVQINIPGINFDFYMEVKALQILLYEKVTKRFSRTVENGKVYVAVIELDSRLLAENCIRVVGRK